MVTLAYSQSSMLRRRERVEYHRAPVVDIGGLIQEDRSRFGAIGEFIQVSPGRNYSATDVTHTCFSLLSLWILLFFIFSLLLTMIQVSDLLKRDCEERLGWS